MISQCFIRVSFIHPFLLTFTTISFESFSFGIVIHLKITIGWKLLSGCCAAQNTSEMCSLMASCFQCDGRVTFFVYTPSERQVKGQRYFIHIHDVVWSDGILGYPCLNEFAEVCNFFLLVRRELLTQSRALIDRPFHLINLRHHDGPPL